MKAIIISEDISNINPKIQEYADLVEIKDSVKLDKIFPTTIDEKLCGGCRVCEDLCDSLIFDSKKNVMKVNVVSCKGCGTCIASCPSGALQQKHLSDGYVFSKIDSTIKPAPFKCNLCPHSILSIDTKYPSDKTAIRLMCSGRAEPSLILDTFEHGVDGVLIIGCYISYENSKRDKNAEKILNETKELMKILGLDFKRLRLEWISASDNRLIEVTREFFEELKFLKGSA